MEVLVFLLPLVLLWVLMIRPQQQRVRQAREMASSLEEGDEVVTAGGIYGTVTDAEGDILTVEVAPGIELRVLRGAIAQRVSPAQEYDEEDEDEDEVDMTDVVDEDEPAAGSVESVRRDDEV